MKGQLLIGLQLLPSRSFPIHYSLNFLPLGALIADSNKPPYTFFSATFRRNMLTPSSGFKRHGCTYYIESYDNSTGYSLEALPCEHLLMNMIALHV
jgi:hypothetical protein